MLSSKCLPQLFNLAPHLSPPKHVHVDESFVPPDPNRRDGDSDRSTLFELWKASKCIPAIPEDSHERWQPPSQAGMRRICNVENGWLAFRILQATFADMVLFIWSVEPLRIATLVFFTLIRGLLPAFRGYSQALIIDEVGLFKFQ